MRFNSAAKADQHTSKGKSFYLKSLSSRDYFQFEKKLEAQLKRDSE
ncbi:hypothetical protein [Coxiella endosymbiont of Ornithodoros maritimus]|nr:hypothetical protein [Coxiella endosymbiont of Ornithodoros maritimus]